MLLYDVGKIDMVQFDQEYVQLLEIRHCKLFAALKEQEKAPLPTECQAAEGQVYESGVRGIIEDFK